MPDDGSTVNFDALTQQAIGAATPQTGDIQGILRQVKGVSGQEAKEISDTIKEQQDTAKEDKAEAKRHLSAEEDYEKQIGPWTQKRPDADPISAFGSLGSVFGILASAFTHQPMINSMNAAAAGINAIRENDLAKYQDAFTAFKENTAILQKRAQMEHDEYQDAKELMQTDMSLGTAKLNAVVAKYGHNLDALNIQRGLYDDIFTRQDKAFDVATQLGPKIAEMIEGGNLAQAGLVLRNAKLSKDPEAISKAQADYNDALQHYADFKSELTGFKPGSVSDPMQVTVKNPDGSTSQTMAMFDKARGVFLSLVDGKPLGNVVTANKIASGGANAQLSQDDLDSMADQYLAGDKSVLQGLGYGNTGASNRAALRDTIQKKAKDRGMSGADIAAKMLEFTELTSQARTLGTQGARLDVAGRAAYKDADLVLQTSADVNRGDFVPLNNGELGLRKNFSDPAAARYLAAINTFVNTYSRAISPTGQPRISDKDHARDLILAGYGKDAIKGTIDILKQEIANEQSSVSESRQDITNAATGKPSPPLGTNVGAAPSGGPQEGQTSASKSGKPIIFKNGQWEYQ